MYNTEIFASVPLVVSEMSSGYYKSVVLSVYSSSAYLNFLNMAIIRLNKNRNMKSVSM